jgi:hypothetical protein
MQEIFGRLAISLPASFFFNQISFFNPEGLQTSLMRAYYPQAGILCPHACLSPTGWRFLCLHRFS